MTKMDKRIANSLWFIAIEFCFMAMAAWSAVLLVDGTASSYWLGVPRCWICLVVGSIMAVIIAPGTGKYVLETIEKYFELKYK